MAMGLITGSYLENERANERQGTCKEEEDTRQRRRYCHVSCLLTPCSQVIYERK